MTFIAKLLATTALSLSLFACGGSPDEAGLDQSSAPIVRDPNCAGPALWLYDGQGNRICFDEPGTLDLEQYCVGPGHIYNKLTMRWECLGGTWAGKVRAYWPGSLSGALLAPPNGVDQGQDPGCEEWFQPMDQQSYTKAGNCAQRATQLMLVTFVQ